VFKRFSVNYLVLLFLIDAVIVQLSLLIAFRLRFIIPLGQVVLPDWIEEHIYVPNLSMHISIGLLWFTLFLFFSCYTPRRIILWFDEFQRLLLAHTVAALSLTGLLYLANIPLLRLVFAYFYVITLVMLIGYRVLLRLWHRFYHDSSASVARILVVGAGSIGRELVIEFERQQWPGIEFVGFLDNDRSKIGETVAGLPVLANCPYACALCQIILTLRFMVQQSKTLVDSHLSDCAILLLTNFSALLSGLWIFCFRSWVL